MPKLSFPRRPKALILLGTAVLMTVGTTVVIAQTAPMEPIQWDRRRLEQLDRNVRRLERALTQRNAAGQPVLVEPDPEVVALQGRVDSMDRRLQDMEDTLQRVNGDLERVGFAAEEAERDNAALRTRLTDAESRVSELETAAELAAPIVADSPTGDAGGDLAAAVRLAAQDPARGARALEVLTVTWPDTPQAREANSRLGDARVSAGDHEGAVQAYARALQGWPTDRWAPDTTLKLANALIESDQKTRACGALGEFRRRYAEAAPPQLRARATQLGGRAECS